MENDNKITNKMDNEIDALDFISMLLAKQSLENEIEVSFNKINQLREDLLMENLRNNLGYYDFEEIEDVYPENVKVKYEGIHIKINDSFIRLIDRRLSINRRSMYYSKMVALWEK